MNPISRSRIALNDAALSMLSLPKPVTFTGAGSSLSLCHVIASSRVKRLMLVTDRPLLERGVVTPMLDALKSEGVGVEVFSDVEPDPGYELVVTGAERLEKSRAEALLAVGGGSPIDCAKAILLSHANRCHPAKLAGVWLYARPRKRGLPFYVVPTTAGTGSEVTIAAVVSDHRARIKRAIIDPKLVPGMVALDPTLTIGLPPFITAPTGMDALTHAVEAYVSRMANAQTDAWALAATTLIARNLPTAYARGADLEARERMLVASSLAGLAFTRAGVGYVHALAHQIGALYHLPHGLVNAIVMPRVLDWSKPRCADRLADLARAAGLGAGGEDEAALADAFVAHIRGMNADMAIPAAIPGLRSADFDRIIKRAFAEAHGTYGVPRYLNRRAARSLLEGLLPN